MSMRTEAQTVRLLRRLVNKWMKVLGLENWNISLELGGNLEDADEGVPAAAECLATWQYEIATIRFAASYAATVSENVLEEDVIHELLHCVLAPMREPGKAQVKHEERTTTHLTRAFRRLTA